MFNPNDIIDENFLTPIPVELLKITDWYANQLNTRTNYLIRFSNGTTEAKPLSELEKEDNDDKIQKIINNTNRNIAEQKKAEIYFRKPTNIKDIKQMDFVLTKLREIYSLKLAINEKIIKYTYLEKEEENETKKNYYKMMIRTYQTEFEKISEHKPMLYPKINMILDRLKLEIVSSIFSASTSRQSFEQTQQLPYQDNSLNAQREISWRDR